MELGHDLQIFEEIRAKLSTLKTISPNPTKEVIDLHLDDIRMRVEDYKYDLKTLEPVS